MRLRLLVCAATQVEARACSRGLNYHPAMAALAEVLRTGIGPERAAEALKRRLANPQLPRPERICSGGFAAGRGEGVRIGDWGVSGEIDPAFRKTLTQSSLRWAEVRFKSVVQVVTSPERGPAAPVIPAEWIDMESEPLAKVALEHGIPFLILRLASDTPEMPLPQAIADFTAASALALTPGQRMRHIARGVSSAFGQPSNMAAFLGRSSRLPGMLERGWSELARAPGLLLD